MLCKKDEIIQMKERFIKMKFKIKEGKGITLIALVITMIFSYDEKLKLSNSKGFLLESI